MTIARKFLALAALALAGFVTAPLSSARAAGSLPPPKGVFVIAPFIQSANTAAVAANDVAAVDGVLIVVGWAVIEPTLGQFVWPAALDTDIEEALVAGKKITLGVMASRLFQNGVFAAPSWLPSLALNLDSNNCSAGVIAEPYAPGYVLAYDAMIAKLADHVRGLGASGAIVMVKASGINQITVETHLPSANGPTGSCPSASNAVAAWQAAGYTPGAVMQSAQDIALAVSAAFPNATLGIDIIFGNNRFPPINNGGGIDSTGSDDLTDPIIQAYLQMSKAPSCIAPSPCVAVYPGAVEVQWDGGGGQADESADDAAIQAYAAQGAVPGMQLSVPSGAPLCGGQSCDATSFQAMMLAWVSGNFDYIEVSPTAVETYPAAIAAAQAAIWGN